jgi:hypothetical protein
MAEFTERQARLVIRVVVEAAARKRCGESMDGLATHCGVSTASKDSALKAAKDEGLLDHSLRLLTER